MSVENMKLLIRWNRTIKQTFSAINNVQKIGFLDFYLLHPQHYLSVNFRCMKMELNTVATEERWCFSLMTGIFNETQMYDTNNFHLIWMNTRKSAVWTSKHLPSLFQVSHQTNQLFDLIKGSTNASSKPEIVDVLKQNTGNASQELSSAIPFLKSSVSLSACFWVYLQSSILKLIKF